MLDKRYKHDISVVVDRLVMRHDLRKRLADSIETAVALRRRAGGDRDRRRRRGRGAGDGEDGRRRTRPAPRARARAAGADHCPARSPEPGTCSPSPSGSPAPSTGPSLVELEPRIFSFNSPHGACDRCTGLGSQMEIDPELVVPDPSLSIGEGALAPWAGSASNYYEQVTEAIAERVRRRPGRAVGGAAGRAARRVPVRHRRRAGPGHLPQPLRPPALLRDALRGDRRRTSSAATARPTPSGRARRSRSSCRCGPARPAAGRGCGPSPARCSSRARASRSSRRSRRAGRCEWLDEVELSETDRHVARLILREISERLRFLENVGIGYLSMDRAAATLSGGEAQRIRLATQIGSSLVGVLYILDEPSIGLHQRDNSKLIATLERLRDLGNTVIVVEHDEQTMRAADHLVDLGPGAGEHGGRDRGAGHRRRGRSACPSRSPASTSRARARSTSPDQAPHAERLHRDPRRQPAQPARHRRAHPARRADLRDRRLGVGQVDARQRRPLQGRRQPPAPRPPASRQRTARSTASSSSTRSSPSTSRRSGARRARTRPPTRACST